MRAQRLARLRFRSHSYILRTSCQILTGSQRRVGERCFGKLTREFVGGRRRYLLSIIHQDHTVRRRSINRHFEFVKTHLRVRTAVEKEEIDAAYFLDHLRQEGKAVTAAKVDWRRLMAGDNLSCSLDIDMLSIIFDAYELEAALASVSVERPSRSFSRFRRSQSDQRPHRWQRCA
jgi:hypothetical protein